MQKQEITYQAAEVVQHREDFENTIETFIHDTTQDIPQILHLNEPVGFGKSRAIRKKILCALKERVISRVLYLTSSNRLAAQIATDFKKEGLSEANLIRIFGVEAIPKEASASQITACVCKDERRRYIDNEESAWKVCERCRESSRCPYFSAMNSARKGGQQVVVGTFGHAKSPMFLFHEVFQRHYDVLVLDEDGVFNTYLELDAHLNNENFQLFLGHLLEVNQTALEQNNPVTNGNTLKAAKLEVLCFDFFKTTGLITKGILPTLDELDKDNQFQRNLRKLPENDFNGEQTQEVLEKYIESWNRLIVAAMSFDCRISVFKRQDTHSDKVLLTLIPNLSNTYKKIIIADATSTIEELRIRFLEGNITQTLPSNFILQPTGKMYQLVEHFSINKAYKRIGALNENYVSPYLEKIRSLTQAWKEEDEEIFLITNKNLVADTRFRELSREYGFKVLPEWHHGNVRGKNDLESKNIVVLGTSFPDDKEVISAQIESVGEVIEYQYNNDFLQWVRDEVNCGWALQPMKPSELGIEKWMTQTTHGKAYGRKKYLESIVQSMRSRFYWHDTNTLVVSGYPLTGFGIAMHGYYCKPPGTDGTYLSPCSGAPKLTHLVGHSTVDVATHHYFVILEDFGA